MSTQWVIIRLDGRYLCGSGWTHELMCAARFSYSAARAAVGALDCAAEQLPLSSF